MKCFQKLVGVILLGAVLAPLAGCNQASETATTQTQTATVERGDLSLEITAAGNLALSTVQDLIFALFYAKGTVGEVNVAAGDTVTKGELIASLDPTEWNDQIQVLEDALTTAQCNVITKQRSLATAQRQVTTLTRQIATKEKVVVTAERLVTSNELAVQQAQLNVISANNTLNKITAVKEIQDEIDNLNFIIKYAALGAEGTFGQPVNWAYWTTILAQARVELAEAQSELQDLLNGTSTLTSADVALQVAQAQLQIKLKQMALEDAQIAVEDAKTAVDDANTSLSNAQQDLTFGQQDVVNAQSDLYIANQKASDAQESLDNARAASPEILAPFDGFVTKVNVAGGDEILNGTVVVQIADPNKFNVAILVSEMDILNLAIGTNGTLTADAIPDVSFPVTVDRISPTATISSSVVNYPVTVEVTSLKALATTQTSTLPTFSGNFTPPRGFNSANFTPGNGFSPSSNFTPRNGFTSANNSALRQLLAESASAAAEKEYTLKSGMTVTVTLTIPLSTNVLLVPSSVITTLNGISFVEVMSSNGTAERRIIITGNTDYTNTEVKSGLNEGDKVVIPTSTTRTTSTTTSSSSNRRNEIFIPGIGGPGG